MTDGVPAGDILHEMDFADLGVVRVGDPLDPEVVPVHVRLDNDDRAGGALSQKRALQRHFDRENPERTRFRDESAEIC